MKNNKIFLQKGIFIYKFIVLAKRKYKSKKKNIVLNKYKIWVWLTVLGWLYFFSLYLAKWSPIFDFLTKYASIAFWEIWLNVFFALCIITGILIVVKWYLIRLLIKQFFLIIFLVWAIINFPIIDWISNQYEQFWWYFSYPMIYLLDQMFWWQNIAIKAFIIIILVWVIWRVLYTFNFSLPKINIRQDKEPKEKVRQTEQKQEQTISQKISQVKKTLDNQNTNPEILKKILPENNTDSDIIKWIFKQKLKQKIEEKQEKVFRQPVSFSSDKPTFSASILTRNTETTTINETFLMEKAKALQNKLMEFNVPVSIEGFDIWPSIVQIRIKPEAGIRISRIEQLANDIALSLRTKSLTVIAPIPWTDSVGIQLPNPKPSMVTLWDILWSPEFAEEMKKNTTCLALWKAIDWTNIVKSLDKMPHLLVAGATGSGKSVWVNDFIISLMYQNSPSELKFLMVDPKQVELELYSGIPYMLAPIVTDPDKALKLLRRAVEEMEIRYSLLKKHRVKKLEEYNAKVIWERMYQIVFVIDELADLMMSGNKKEVENCITRIAQKARAIGIHLIVATQRPSVNVITGLIKANMPTRIAFGVVSEIDSRTILWRKWAEELLWKWDLLYSDPSSKHPIRIQAPYVDTKEIEIVVQRIKNKYMWNLTEDDIYHPEIIKALESKLETVSSINWGWGGWNDEDLIEQAIQVISETKKASATLLQRKLNVGFARAARIMDELEARWVVGPQDWAKPRDIYL